MIWFLQPISAEVFEFKAFICSQQELSLNLHSSGGDVAMDWGLYQSLDLVSVNAVLNIIYMCTTLQ